MCVMVQLRGLLGTNFSLEEHSAILGTNIGNYVSMGTFVCTGDIRGQKLVPKGTIPRGTNVGNYISMRTFFCAGDKY